MKPGKPSIGAPKSAPGGLWSLVYDEPLRTSERPAVPVREQPHQIYSRSRWFDRHPVRSPDEPTTKSNWTRTASGTRSRTRRSAAPVGQRQPFNGASTSNRFAGAGGVATGLATTIGSGFGLGPNRGSPDFRARSILPAMMERETSSLRPMSAKLSPATHDWASWSLRLKTLPRPAYRATTVLGPAYRTPAP